MVFKTVSLLWRESLVSFFVALHGPLSSLFQPLGVPSRTPFPTFGGSLSSLLQRLRGPSPFLVALRGYLFAFSWKSFLPFPTFGGSFLSLLQPLSGPSPFLVALRGYLFAFSWKSFSPFPTLGGSLSSLLQRLSTGVQKFDDVFSRAYAATAVRDSRASTRLRRRLRSRRVNFHWNGVAASW